MIEAGNLDEQITIEDRTATQDADLGTYDYVWSEFATVWADVREMLPGRADRIMEGVSIQNKPLRIWIRWLDGVTSEMRVLWRGGTYRIVGGPAELGRREGMELVCELKTTEGNEA